MAEKDESVVSRRGFFRGLTGELFKAVGELTGLDAEPESRPIRSYSEDDVIVPPEKQTAAVDDIFGFLERLNIAEPDVDPQAPTMPDLVSASGLTPADRDWEPPPGWGLLPEGEVEEPPAGEVEETPPEPEVAAADPEPVAESASEPEPAPEPRSASAPEPERGPAVRPRPPSYGG